MTGSLIIQAIIVYGKSLDHNNHDQHHQEFRIIGLTIVSGDDPLVMTTIGIMSLICIISSICGGELSHYCRIH